jgi:hypothetical protein
MSDSKIIHYANPEKRKLTLEEVRERMPGVMDQHLAPILNGQYYHDFDADGAKEYVNYLYTYCGHKPVKDFYVTENPREALSTARKILKNPNYTYSLFYACSIYSAAYWAWHKFIKDNCKPDFEHAEALDNFYKLYMDARIFSAILHEDFAIVSKSATNIKMMNDRLHSPDGKAITFEHADEDMSEDCYFWKGVQVPEQLIMAPETLTARDIASVKNAEMKKCYIQAMGPSLFFKRLGGKSLKVIDTAIDKQGHEMKLLQFDFEGREVQSIEVYDPSSNPAKLYVLSPTRMCTNVWEAKRSTFSDEKIMYRQGDVGLLHLEEECEYPLVET